MTVVLAAASTAERATAMLAELAGLAILAGTLALVAAFAYRWYVREPIPEGLAILVGLSAVAAYLNTTTVLGEVLGGTSNATQAQEALFNIAAFGAGVAGAALGRRLGDGFGTDVFDATTFAEVDDDVGRLVKAVGRVLTVTLPEEIDDVVGYDPVPEATTDALAGQSFVFPRRLTIDELHDRLVARLRTDYGVGHVDVELDEDGSISYLALGSRAAGIGPTLPPATNAMAIRADPALAASSGDLVQVWETDPTRRVLTAELRGVADDVVTVAIDAADTSKLDPTREYRLVTLPVEDRPDREFASLLRAAEETFASVTVQRGSSLDGLAVGSLDVTVLSVVPGDGDLVVLPSGDHVLGADDVVHAIARPDSLRRLEAAASDDPADRPDAPSAVADRAGDGSIREADRPDEGGSEATGTGNVVDAPADGTAPSDDGATTPDDGTPSSDDSIPAADLDSGNRIQEDSGTDGGESDGDRADGVDRTDGADGDDGAEGAGEADGAGEVDRDDGAGGAGKVDRDDADDGNDESAPGRTPDE